MAAKKIITAIDVGTDKCVTLVASRDADAGLLKVLGVAAVPSRGMKKSQIIDLEQVLLTITESVDAAERMAGLDVKSAFVSISGTHVASQNSKGVVAVARPEEEISDADVERVIEAAKAISLPSDREIIHIIPKHFSVDSQTGIKDPVGMTGVRLESEAHIVTAMSTAMRNMEKCVQDLGLEVEGFVFSGLAASEVVVSETEKELGVAVVDIGAGSTSICVFVDGALEYSAALPVGARHITQDIALGCKVSLDTAERIKLSLASDPFYTISPNPGESKTDFTVRKKKADRLRLSHFDNSNTDEVLSKKTIAEGIMLPRMQEIFDLIAERLSEQELLDMIPAGVVITGGGALTVKIAEVAKRELQLPARTGEPVKLEGLTTDIHKPSYATSIGLLMYGDKHGGEHHGGGLSFGRMFKGLSPLSAFRKIGGLVKSLLP